MEYEQPTYRGRRRKDDLEINNVGPNQLRFKTFSYSGETALFDGYGRVGENKQTETIQNSEDNKWGLSEAQLLEAEKLSDRASIPYHEALNRLGYVNGDVKNHEDFELDDGHIVNTVIEGLSVDLKTRNYYINLALDSYLAASQHGGRSVHFDNSGEEQSKVVAEAEYRDKCIERADKYFDIAFGTLALKNAGLDDRDIKKMAFHESIEFSKAFTGRKHKDDREDYRKLLRKQRKEFGWGEE